VSAPSILRNGGDLDEIRPARDGFFVSMHSSGHSLPEMREQLSGARTFYASTRGDQAKRIAKARSARGFEVIPEARDEKKISLSLRPQEIHQPSTGFPQP
jgi:hypothetical protein